MAEATLHPTADPSFGTRAASPPIRVTFLLLATLFLGVPAAFEASAWLFPDRVPIPQSLDGEVMDARAIPFSLRDLSGNLVHLEDLRGKTVFLNFWATWCPPCVEELPSMVALGQAMAGENFAILAVSEDDRPEDVRRFFGGVLPGFPVVMDEAQKITRLYGTFKFPETYVIGPDGRVKARFVGPRKWDDPEAVDYFRALASR